MREFKQKLNDPDLVVNLKGPLPIDWRLILIAEIERPEGWFSHWRPGEPHALLLNVGAELEPSIARCTKPGPTICIGSLTMAA